MSHHPASPEGDSPDVFYGGAIQGAIDRYERAHVHAAILGTIREEGFATVAEHTTGRNREETAALLEEAIGPLPPLGLERSIYVRRKMIEGIEGDREAAIFEVSQPSLGTGIELAHAYLRPRMGLSEIPILCLYQEDYWPGKLSTMIRGIDADELPNLAVVEYKDLPAAVEATRGFLRGLARVT